MYNGDSGTDYFSTTSASLSTVSHQDIAMSTHLSDTALTPSSFEGVNSLLSIFTTQADMSMTPMTTCSSSPSCQTAFSDSKSNADQPQDCMTLALNTLRSLHTPPSTCSFASVSAFDSGSSPIPTIDHVLSTNKAIIDSLGVIINCSCSVHPQLHLLLTLIVSKIVAWYSAVARSDSDNDASSMSSGTSNKSTTATERVLHLPIMVGKYNLDGVDKGKMRAQLVLGELHRVVRFVGQLSKRFEEMESAADEQVSGEETELGRERASYSMYVELEAFLRQQVRAVTKEAMDVLREK
jgi:hypothetical protein